MLSGILNSSIAINVNIQIMRTFVRVRHVLSETNEIRLEIEKIKKNLDIHVKTFELVFDHLEDLTKKVDEIDKKQKYESRKRIGFKEK